MGNFSLTPLGAGLDCGCEAGGTAAERAGEGAEEFVRLASPGGGPAFETSGLVGDGSEPKPGGGAVAD